MNIQILAGKVYRRALLYSNQLSRYVKYRSVRYGTLRRTVPISNVFGMDRGRPIDRYYIDRFIEKYAKDISGRVLEIGDNSYTKSFGASNVIKSDVLHLVSGNPRATIIADLADAREIPSESFDCIICTQTLQFIFEVDAAVKTLHRILKNEGVLLVSVPGISQISSYDMERWGDYWRFTTRSLEFLFKPIFGSSVQINSYGNVLVALSFLHGLAQDELSLEELDKHDENYQVVLTVRAVKGVV